MKFATTVKPKDQESRKQGITLKIKPIGGSVSAVMLTDKYGQVGFYIVRERSNGTDKSNNMRAQEVAGLVIALERDGYSCGTWVTNIYIEDGCALFGIEESDLPGRFSTKRG